MDEETLAARYVSFAGMTVPQAAVDRGIQKILSKTAPGRFRRSSGPFDLARIYAVEPPRGGAHLFKVAIYTPRQVPTICVLVTNLVDGWNSLCHNLAREHRQFQIQAKSTRPGAEWPQNKIDVWSDGKSSRVVMAMRDSDAWKFFQKGEPQDFEEVALYEKRIIRQRLDRDAIIRYLRRIGWDISKLSFWESTIEANIF
jgi:hypothetical protein